VEHESPVESLRPGPFVGRSLRIFDPFGNYTVLVLELNNETHIASGGRRFSAQKYGSAQLVGVLRLKPVVWARLDRVPGRTLRPTFHN
jgi:hypothetical protein